jgi:hypothetical protein
MFLRICFFIITIIYALFAQVADVNLSTGQLEFSKKLLTINSHRLSFPINLSYNTRITKHQRSSWVGLGFDLDMPYIERKVRAYPDERHGHSKYQWSNVYALREALAPPPPALSGQPRAQLLFDYYTYSALLGGFQQVPSSTPCGIPSLDRDRAGCIDESTLDLNCDHLNNATQQDNYSINMLPADGGQIFFSNSGTALITPYKKWRVEYTDDIGPGNDNANILSWTLTDESGTRYIFSDAVTSKPVATSSNETDRYRVAKITYMQGTEPRKHISTVIEQEEYTSPYISRWYLSRIESYDGDWIQFQYPPRPTSATLYDNPYINNVNKYSYKDEAQVSESVSLFL